MWNARLIIENLLLIVGGGLIIGSAAYTLTHLSDHVVFAVLLPGVVVGLLLIGGFVMLNRRHSRE